MIKRALGIWNEGGDGDEDDDALTAKETEKLTRRLLPGGRGGKSAIDYAKAAQAAEAQDEEADEDESEGVLSGDEAYDSDDSDMPMPAPTKVEKTPFRGHFHCKLCPDKVIMHEKGLEEHLQSKSHLKREKDFNRAKDIGLAALEAEVKAKVKAKTSAAPTKRDERHAAYWSLRRKRIKENKRRPTIDKDLTEEQIMARKARFQSKKDRRLAKEAGDKAADKAPAAAQSSKKPNKVAEPSRLEKADATKRKGAAAGGNSAEKQPNRKARRAALQSAVAAKDAKTGGKQTVGDTPAVEAGGVLKKKKRKKEA